MIKKYIRLDLIESIAIGETKLFFILSFEYFWVRIHSSKHCEINIVIRTNNEAVTVIECNKQIRCKLVGLFDASCY